MFNFLGMFSGANVRVRRNRAERKDEDRRHEARLNNFIPRECPDESDTVLSAELNSRMLFFSLTSQGCTGLVEISSETQRVRAGLLLIDGNLVGAFFGRHSIEGKLYGRAAYDEILSQLAHLETRVSVQPLSNKLALAALPIFQEKLGSDNTIVATDPNELLEEIREQKCFGVGFVDDINGDVSEIFYFADGKIFCRYYPVSGEATFLPPDSRRETRIAFKNGSLRVYLASLERGENNEGACYSINDLEGNKLIVTLTSKDESTMASVLRRNFHPGGLVSVLTKNRMSHREEQTKIIRQGEQKAIRPARIQHHSHFVNPCRHEP